MNLRRYLKLRRKGLVGSCDYTFIHRIEKAVKKQGRPKP